MRFFKTVLLGFLLLTSMAASATKITCPDLRDIQRVSGQYSWTTPTPGWEGFFASPYFGRGESVTLKYFKEARWLQLSNLNDSKGVLECDYVGNYNDEIIRFVLSMNQTTEKPRNQNWMCQFNPDFPGQQCKCVGEAAQCWAEP